MTFSAGDESSESISSSHDRSDSFNVYTTPLNRKGLQGVRMPHSPAKSVTKQQQELYHLWVPVAIILGVILLFAFAYYAGLFHGQPEKQPIMTAFTSRDDLIQNFNERFAVLKASFPQQTERFWKILRASTKPVMASANPRAPATLIIAGKSGADFRAGQCIAERFSALVDEVYGSTGVLKLRQADIEAYRSDSAGLKLYLDQQMRAHFENGGRAFLLDRMHLVPGKAMEIYHGYCDNDNAPFKDVSIVFTVECPGDKSYPDERDVEYFLEDVWAQELENNVYSSLSTRVSNMIAIANAESQDTFRKHC